MSTSQLGFGATAALPAGVALTNATAETADSASVGSPPATLAFTGFEVTHSLIAGIGLLFIGLIILLFVRRVEEIPTREI